MGFLWSGLFGKRPLRPRARTYRDWFATHAGFSPLIPHFSTTVRAASEVAALAAEFRIQALSELRNLVDPIWTQLKFPVDPANSLEEKVVINQWSG